MADKTQTNGTPVQPILDLDAFEAGPLVQFEGKQYAMRPPASLPIFTLHRFERLRVKWFDLWATMDKQDLTPDEEKEFTGTLDQICRIILDAPDDVHARLGDVRRLEIAWTFYMLPYPTRRGAGAMIAVETTTAPQTGASSYPGSSDSMEAPTRSDG